MEVIGWLPGRQARSRSLWILIGAVAAGLAVSTPAASAAGQRFTGEASRLGAAVDAWGAATDPDLACRRARAGLRRARLRLASARRSYRHARGPAARRHRLWVVRKRKAAVGRVKRSVRRHCYASLPLTFPSPAPLPSPPPTPSPSPTPPGETSVAPSNGSPPTISGAAQAGQTLTAEPGAWSGSEPIGYGYRWRRCDAGGGGCADIAGADGQSYTLAAADVDSTLRVAVTATNAAGSSTASSQPTALVEAEPAAPVNSSPPTVSGTAREGEQLSAQRGVWAGSEPIGYGYQWRRCSSLDVCEDVVGASAESYTLTAADVGFSMQVRVTASNAVGWSAASSQRTATVEAKPVAPVNGSPPTISGAAQAGQTLTAERGAWSGSEPIGYGYRWRRCDAGGGGCADIVGADGQSYTLAAADVDSTLRVAVTATNAAGSSTASSQPTALVEAEPAAPVNSSPPTVSGTAREGEQLSAQRGVWAGSEPIGYGYQWRRCSSLDVCEDVVGASAESYTLTAADVGFSMQVRVTASNAVGWSAASSQRTATVEAKPVAPVNGSPPTISGAAQAGQTLTAERGAWSGSEPIGYGYRWRRCDAGGGGCADIVGADGQSYTLAAADVDSTLRVAVTATNAAGSSTASSQPTALVEAEPAPDTTAPSAPSGLTATPGDGSVALDWDDNAESDLAGYRVYRRNADGSWPTSPLTTTTVSNYTNSGLTNGTSYTYRATAVDGSGNEGAPSSSASATPAAAPSPEDPVVTAAGDIAGSATDGVPTADLIKAIDPTAVLTLGDNAYEDGTLQQYNDYYDPSWGAFKSKTYPIPGNHDYHTPGGADYFTYFGARAQAEYYSYDLGSWHLIALNGELPHSAGSPQEVWLKGDLAANAGKCTLAYWHEPRFTSATVHSNDTSFDPFWEDLYAARADVVLNGHNHNYERFARQNPQGQADPAGMREFVVGTGGESHYGFGGPEPNSEVRNGDTFGVLKLTLHPDSYDFEFAPVAGQTFTDGPANTKCHNGSGDTTPPAVPADVATTPGDGHVALDWSDNSEADLAGYRVYRNGNRIAGPTGSSYDDSGVENGKSYSYQVSAIDEAGNESAKSVAVAATPQASSSTGPYPLRGIYSRETDGSFDRQTALGFNLIDSDPDDLGDVNGTSEKAMVWVGSYDRSSCQFEMSDATLRSHVEAHIGDPRVAVWYLSNEPVFGGDADCPDVYAQHQARSELIHSIDPDAKTLVVIDGNSGEAGGLPPYTLDEIPKWKDATDIVGINAYVCRQGEPCEYGWIDKLGQAAAAAGLNFWGQVQAFGEPAGQGFDMCTDTKCGKPRLPTADELHEQFNHWRATKMTGYLVFQWRWPTTESSLWLANHPELQSQLSLENSR